MGKKTFNPRHFSNPSLLILISLVNGPKHGYAIMENIAQFCRTQLEAGTLYGVLARLEEHDWIKPLETEHRRQSYQITPEGLAELHEQIRTLNQIISIGQERLATNNMVVPFVKTVSDQK